MQIRQLALHYRPEADRLLLRVNSADGQLFAVWFTRRLAMRLWPHLNQMVTQLGVQHEVAQLGARRETTPQKPDATLLPEARAMLADAARERALKKTDFATPFDTQTSAHPLGPDPILATEVQLAPLPNGCLRLIVIDGAKRTVQLQLTEELATAVRELMAQALRQADWGLAIEIPVAAVEPAPQDKRHLN
jgi:hypothetical protein